MAMSTKFYLAGKMSGIPQFNFPLFLRVAKALRNQGYDIVSPAEIDDYEDKLVAMNSKDGRFRPGDKTWGDFLARDVKLLADGGITGIIFLPGWEASAGAKLEATVGLLKRFNFMRWDDSRGAAVPLARMSVACALHQEFANE
jgi:Domain of unknown function (DUF4406)